MSETLALKRSSLKGLSKHNKKANNLDYELRERAVAPWEEARGKRKERFGTAKKC